MRWDLAHGMKGPETFHLSSRGRNAAVAISPDEIAAVTSLPRNDGIPKRIRRSPTDFLNNDNFGRGRHGIADGTSKRRRTLLFEIDSVSLFEHSSFEFVSDFEHSDFEFY